MERQVKKLAILFWLLCSAAFAHDAQTQDAFLDSFIKYYDFTTVGRYTHEYHPFLFEKSSLSLDELEENIENNGMSIKGRIVIAGYEEAAVPSYYSNYKVCTGSKINDEVRIRDAAGWTKQLHNKFGVMTGYLFRDVPIISEYCQRIGKESLFEHINLHTMAIYNRDAGLFQRHAFGKMFGVMENQQTAINISMCKGDGKGLFSNLINFWRTLYECELQFGNRQVLGTQDVLFSIAHAQHLYRSPVPLLKYYAGPDITYPIKVTPKQKESATFNAQAFVKRFAEHIKPINDEPTAYIFCSFVDGVGKSTLLGNVQNYQKYVSDVKSYDAVDNSSSQLPVRYKCYEKVFIIDLPAQMSHFTYKPDGMVYFDPLADEGFAQKQYDEAVEFVIAHKADLIEAHKKMLEEAKLTVAKEGWFARSLCNKKDPQRAFAKNLLLMKREEKNEWIPFEYKEQQYLFYRKDPEQLRRLLRLEIADSIGLKNYEAEQMLFFEGVKFPLSYHEFLSDLIKKLKDRNVKNVVFVDFLSMYPRSSRENIRINYLLQQLSLLHNDFSVEESSYGTFVNDAHLYHRMKRDKNGKMLDSFKKESRLRLALYNVMKAFECKEIAGIKLRNMTELLSGELQKMPTELKKKTAALAKEKLDREVRQLGRVHENSKDYVNIQELDFDDVVALGKKLQKFFAKHVVNKRLRRLWKKIEDSGDLSPKLHFSKKNHDGPVHKEVTLSNGEKVRLLYIFAPECKNIMILAPVLRQLRSAWYCALTNIVGAKALGDSKNINVEKERYFVAPVWVQKTEDGRIALLQSTFDWYGGYQDSKKCNDLQKRRCDKDDEQQNDAQSDAKKREIKRVVQDPTVDVVNFSPLATPEWGTFEEVPYLLNADRSRTDRGLFAFGCNLLDYGRPKWPGFGSDISRFVRKHKEEEKDDTIISTQALWKKFKNNYWWKKRFKRAVEEAKKNDKTKKPEKKEESTTILGSNGEKVEIVKKDQKGAKQRILLGKSEHKRACQLAARAFATIEMVIKDANADIAVRRENKKDFMAALKLFEKIVLPSYLDIIFEENLYGDYFAVKPFIPIELRKL